MDLNKLRNAKNDREEAEKLQKEKEEAEKLALKAKQESLIKQYVDKLTKPFVESQINNITDEELDEILVKNIFEKDNESDSYILPIKMELNLLHIKFNREYPNDQYYKKYPNSSARWVEEWIDLCSSKIDIFNETKYTINPDIYEYYFIGEELDEKEEKDPMYEDNDFKDIMNNYIINWLTEALKTTTNVKYLYDREDQNDNSYYYAAYFNPYNEKNITDALIKRLEEYGLKILDIKVDESIDKEYDYYHINYEIKFKNPLK